MSEFDVNLAGSSYTANEVNHVILPERPMDREELQTTIANAVAAGIEELKKTIQSQPLAATPDADVRTSSATRSNVIPAAPTISQPTTQYQIVSGSLPLKPTFNGKSHPMRFLKDFEHYCNRIALPIDQWSSVVLECVSGFARNWVDSFNTEWGDFESFKRDFIKSFWSREQQNLVRQRISRDTFNQEAGHTMSAHLLYYVAQARLLTDAISEDVLVMELMSHFPLDVRSLWSVANKTTVMEAVTFLNKLEQIQNMTINKRKTYMQHVPLITGSGHEQHTYGNSKQVTHKPLVKENNRMQPYAKRPQNNHQTRKNGNGKPQEPAPWKTGNDRRLL